MKIGYIKIYDSFHRHECNQSNCLSYHFIIYIIKMKHQITPWSIYDRHLNNPGPYSLEQKNQQENRQLSLLPQQNFFDIRRIGSIKKKITLQEQKIDKGLNSIIYLQIIRRELQLCGKNQIQLPEIKQNFRVDEYRMRRLRPNKINQSKLSNYTNDQRKVQQLNHSTSQQSKINVINYDPFDHAQIIQRGLIQIMKIRQRINKSQSKDHPNLNQI